MSYTRKVTVIKQGCSGQRITTTTVSHSSSSSVCGATDNVSWIKEFSQPSSQTFSSNCSMQKPLVTRNAEPTTKVHSSGSSSGTTPFEGAVLDEHNRLRARHSAPPLALNPAISRYAQEWANNLAKRNTMQHRSNNQYGENLYACYGKVNITGEEVVKCWYDEIQHYRFGQPNPTNFSQVGHFTQVVWKGSSQLGVGIAKNGNNTYVVCNYDPPGNFNGRYPANVTAN